MEISRIANRRRLLGLLSLPILLSAGIGAATAVGQYGMLALHPTLALLPFRASIPTTGHRPTAVHEARHPHDPFIPVALGRTAPASTIDPHHPALTRHLQIHRLAAGRLPAVAAQVGNEPLDAPQDDLRVDRHQPEMMTDAGSDTCTIARHTPADDPGCRTLRTVVPRS